MTPFHSPDASRCWINQLQPAQLAMARTIQQHGLVGRPLGSAEFAWVLNGKLLVTSGQQATLIEAFDVSVQQLSSSYTTS